jgi:SSS family solute:Na+ symporter
MDIYKVHFKPLASEENLVKTGRISCIFIIAVAAFIASFLTGINQVFQFIQEYTGLISPGITAIFVLGIFWKKTTAKAAWIAVLITLPVPLILKYFFPELPFLDNMLISFLIISAQIIVITLLENKDSAKGQEWELPTGIFKMNDPVFKWFAAGIMVIIVLLYSVFW